MKKLLALIFATSLLLGFASCSSSSSSDVTTINVKANMLNEYLAEHDLTDVEKLSIRGELTYTDFGALAKLTKLSYLDLQSVAIKGTSLSATEIYRDNELSGEFFHATSGATRFPNLTTIILPSYLTTLGNETFKDYKALTEVRMFNRLETIGTSAFENCSALTELAIPVNVKTIGAKAFYGCKELQTVNLPEGLKTIETGVFGLCEKLSAVTIPASVDKIEQSAFTGSGITSIVLPDAITSISAGLFQDCKNLKSITLSDKITEIRAKAFSGCAAIASITIPKNVKTIEDKAFENCSSLTQVHAQMVSPADKINESFIFSGFKDNCRLYVPEGSKTAYLKNALWNVFGGDNIEEE